MGLVTWRTWWQQMTLRVASDSEPCLLGERKWSEFALNHFIVLALVVITVVYMAPAAQKGTAEQHEIKFSRPWSVGDLIRLEGSAGRNGSVMIEKSGEQEIVQSEWSTITMEGTMLVDAVGEDGELREAGIRLKSFWYFHEVENVEDRLPANTMVRVKFDDDGAHFEIDGEVPDDVIVKSLKMVFSFDAMSEEVYGTSGKHAVGDRWAINGQQLSDDLRVNGIDVAADKLDGHATITGERTVEGMRCLDIATEVAATEFKLADQPPGGTVDSSELTIKQTFVVPVDLDRPLRRHEIATHYTVVLSTPGPDGTVTKRTTRLLQRWDLEVRKIG